MKYFATIILLITIQISQMMANEPTGSPVQKHDSTALILIDIQEFYFEGDGKLQGCEEASEMAFKVLSAFRAEKLPVIHVMHGEKSPIHSNVKPIEGEKVIVKHEINSFLGTDLLVYLREHHIKKLVLCGMMTHMCLEAATRAASDYGFACTVIHDACATRDLKFGDYTVKAQDVHHAVLAALTYYAKVISAKEFLKEF